MTDHARTGRHRQRPLREGFTTGSAAAAAAAAAAALLLGGKRHPVVSIPLPPVPLCGDTLDSSACPRLDIPIAGCAVSAGYATASVIKDGGDDPDATHGLRIYARVSISQPLSINQALSISLPLPDGSGQPQAHEGTACLSPAIIMPCGITLYGGVGVGRCTLPGLPIAPGEAAINPEPRKQISAALLETARRHNYTGPLHCCISVPTGEHAARHTLNARLGITGGISILGTRGIVRPYSHDAWKATIAQGVQVAHTLGEKTICFSTGRRSERALMEHFPMLPQYAYVQAADYAGFSLQCAAHYPFERIIWGCFPGKLLKLAQGLEWTHARSAPPDFALLARLCTLAGVPDAFTRKMCDFPTAVGAIGFLEDNDPVAAAATLRRMAERAGEHMRAIIERAGTHAPRLSLQVFSLEGRLVVSCDSSAE